MNNFKDITGQKFGKLTVIERAKNNKSGNACWKCLCDCGNIVIVCGTNLRTNKTKSCGCFCNEKTRERNTKHNLYYSRIYNTWANMKTRCLNSKNKMFKEYGGRGITVCEDWKNDFMSFYDWSIKNGYNDNLSIDRIDVNGNYEPNNCRWVTMKEQANNKRNNTLLTIKGETKTIHQWADSSGINHQTIRSRIREGKEGEDLIKPLCYKRKGKNDKFRKSTIN